MNTKFKEVAHLYLGCELDTDCHGQGIQGHMPISFKELDADNLATILYQLSNDEWNHYCKPILRPLSDITKEEISMAYEIAEPYHQKLKNEDEVLVGSAKLTKFLLDKGFDLFGLIESGEAIDKTKLAEQ